MIAVYDSQCPNGLVPIAGLRYAGAVRGKEGLEWGRGINKVERA